MLGRTIPQPKRGMRATILTSPRCSKISYEGAFANAGADTELHLLLVGEGITIVDNLLMTTRETTIDVTLPQGEQTWIQFWWEPGIRVPSAPVRVSVSDAESRLVWSGVLQPHAVGIPQLTIRLVPGRYRVRGITDDGLTYDAWIDSAEGLDYRHPIYLHVLESE